MTGLTNGTSYTFSIAAVNGRGAGMTATGARDRRRADRADRTASAGLPGSVVLHWTGPSVTNTGPATGTSSPRAPVQRSPDQHVLGARDHGDRHGPDERQPYTFVVAAVNGSGTGPQSLSTAVLTVP